MARPVCIAFYGSLMRRCGDRLAELGIADALRPIGDCVLRGALYSLGPWPGLVEGDGRVHGELHELIDERALAVLDDFEDYRPHDPASSLYERRKVALLEPAGVIAWSYWWLGETSQERRIASGRWTGTPAP